MKDRKKKEGDKKVLSSESLNILINKWKDGTFYEILHDWKWIFHYSARYKGMIVLYVFLGILSTSLSLVSSVAGKYMIDIIAGYKISKLPIVALIMVGGAIVSLVLNSVVNRISAKLSVLINNDIQADIFDKIIDAEWLAISKYSNGDILSRFNSDVGTVSGNAITWLPSIIIGGYSFAASFVVIWYYDWIMALIALGSAPVMLLLSRGILKRQRDYNLKIREMGSQMMAFEVETFGNFDTIKSFGIAQDYSQKMRLQQEQYKDVSLKYNMFSIKINILMSCMGYFVQFMAFGYCLFRLWTGDITYGTMTLFLQQRSSLSSAFQNLISVAPAFLLSSVAAGRIRELTELPKEIHIPVRNEVKELANEGMEVRMKRVAFSYTEDAAVVYDSSFKVQPGEIVAFVGPSGEGKTTVLRMLLGLIHPERGEVFLRGKDGQPIPVNAETRCFFAYVPQGNTILSGTIADNMRMAKQDATDEEIVEALKTACAWEFVEKMPGTINSSVGERGRGLSEGQAQRLAIARAILRDAPILLLDEATSALDVATERRVLQSIISRDPNKLCIVTTHRPSVLNMCHRVYQVRNSRITELDEETASKLAMDY